MPWITNISLAAAVRGDHPAVKNKDAVLIQIQDFGTFSFAVPAARDKFWEIHQFTFDDLDTDTKSAIQTCDAATIADVLRNALQNGKNVIVHCHAGICRSGAVAEVGIMLGFEDASSGNRKPNTRVKTLLRRSLGLIHSWE